MKNQVWTMLLVALLSITVLATTALAFMYVQATRQLNRLQAQVTMIAQRRNLMHSLVSDAVEYSRRNPAIEPILREFGISPTPVPEADQ